MSVFRLIAALLPIIFWSGTSYTQSEFDILLQEFDARPLSTDEKRVLQSALAFSGYYNGYLDGKWGKFSQESIERYSSAKFNEEPLNIAMALLVVDFLKNIDEFGWEYVHSPSLGISFALPLNGQKAPLTRNGEVIFEHQNSSLRFKAYWHQPSSLALTHNKLLSKSAYKSETYELRNPEKWVSSIEDSRGVVWHLSSQKIDTYWVSLFVTADKINRNLLNTVVASSTTVRNPSWHLPDNGYLNKILQLTALYLEDEEISNADEVRTGSGTGFYVNSQAHIMTNFHVIKNCSQILVKGEAMKVLWDWEDSDLALLSPMKPQEVGTFAEFSLSPAKLNSDVTVIGFPLQGILEGAIVTRGSISGLKGIGGDIKAIQITAGIQPGNSGGPVVDQSGAIVGIVFGKLDSQKMADATGDIPQNVNFAVKSEVAKVFLTANGVDFSHSSDEEILSPTEIAELALKFTVPITCQ